MTTAIAVRFVEDRPFERFEIVTVDGRTIRAPHSDYVSLERHATVMIVYLDDGRWEFVDVTQIVSIRTIDPTRDPER